MPSDNVCLYNDVRITVEQAKRIRAVVPKAEWRQVQFLCMHCGGLVKPHLGDDNKPHFEHWPGENAQCPIRHVPRRKSTRVATLVKRDFDDVATIEGTKSDALQMVSDRDRAAASNCKKRDKYTCQACSFYLKVGKRYVIDCHHLYPLALGRRETRLDDLASLCPTCHRIAHTRDIPLTINEIQSVRGLKS